ncbi:hypothetical protein [Cellulomonas sp. ATA003]|uniref:hypothetical protein n=1 Tax=Cellulomonas sp. ATA003 TaxID=3073064 RepID=UPI002873C20A|nr:hypothetical protein [Cellulomonas sp. ATA003]WNB86831.1 hypothetical protein REH70_06490 [Cellulomonas sp. ATA003]
MGPPARSWSGRTPPARRRVEPDVAVECELDPPAERVDAAAFAARRLAEQLQAMLLERSASCGRLRITARTESGEELVRTWRTDAGGLGGLSATRITDRVRWQLEGWLSGGGRAGAGAGGAVRTGTPEPSALVRLGVVAEEVAPAGAEQGRLWGGASGGDLRAHRALLRVQGLLGGDGVLVATLQGGRDVRDQVHLVPWGDARATERAADRPWPGRLPEPAPATVLVEPVVVDVLDDAGRTVRVDARLVMSAPPVTVSPSSGVAGAGDPGDRGCLGRLVSPPCPASSPGPISTAPSGATACPGWMPRAGWWRGPDRGRWSSAGGPMRPADACTCRLRSRTGGRCCWPARRGSGRARRSMTERSHDRAAFRTGRLP